jgi:hypothetical protein
VGQLSRRGCIIIVCPFVSLLLFQIHHTTTRKMEVSTQNLYPVVQDLTDAEYGYGYCCCGSMLGSFSLEDLAVPVITPRALPPPPPPSLKPPKAPNNSHRRGHSLFSLTSSKSDLSHRRSNSSPSMISEDSSSTFCTESEERVTDSTKFEESFVLTRQVST